MAGRFRYEALFTLIVWIIVTPLAIGQSLSNYNLSHLYQVSESAPIKSQVVGNGTDAFIFLNIPLSLEKINSNSYAYFLTRDMKKDPEAYEAFWDQFGMVLKEGLYEDIESRDKILEICLFRSARSGTLISLADYVAAMPDTQDKIYTLSAENAEQAETSPHLEGFRARDIDVLLMTDPVDEFWMQAVTEFEGKAFASATRGISDLDKVAPKSNSEKAEEIPDDDARNQEFASLITKVKATLGEDVKEVRLSKTLTDSPVCLVADEEGMDIQMERLMKAHNKDFAGSPRILEINPDHKLIKGMASQIEANGDPALLDDAAKMLLDQAQILEGRPPASLTEFAKRMTRLMERGLSA